jgi:hypothetical protein
LERQAYVNYRKEGKCKCQTTTGGDGWLVVVVVAAAGLVELVEMLSLWVAAEESLLTNHHQRSLSSAR